ncbi:MAG: hypothetical protein V1738_05105 [Patescibacteria group bacterium]
MEETIKDYIREEIAALRRVLLYVADIGQVGFISMVCLMLIGAAAEMFYPGLLFNQLSPQWLITTMVFFGALALTGPKRRRSIFRIVVFSCGGAGFVGLIGWSAWNYFSGISDQIMLTVAVASVGAIVVVGALLSVIGPVDTNNDGV